MWELPLAILNYTGSESDIYVTRISVIFIYALGFLFFYLKIWLQQLAMFQILFSLRNLNDHWSTAIEKINLCIVYNIFILFYLYLTVYKKVLAIYVFEDFRIVKVALKAKTPVKVTNEFINKNSLFLKLYLFIFKISGIEKNMHENMYAAILIVVVKLNTTLKLNTLLSVIEYCNTCRSNLSTFCTDI